MKILVTGAAGFIGSALTLRLLERGDEVIGVDNHNGYYDPALKEARLSRHADHPNYTHIRQDIMYHGAVSRMFQEYRPQRVVNLAAQAGVRYSLENPFTYLQSNILGFGSVLEGCRQYDVEHLVYASSSSVYGANKSMPFSVHDNVDHPLSLYAATKKADELMAHTYSHLYRIPTTGLRFFTVYGPWDRPDMALQKFAHAIMNDNPIDVYNHGGHRRDFTYIDDIVEGIICVLDKVPTPNPDWSAYEPDAATSDAPYQLYNIGNNNTVELLHYIEVLEECLGKKAKKNMLPLQDGDVVATYADVDDLIKDVGYKPSTKIEEGIEIFAKWFKNYYEY